MKKLLRLIVKILVTPFAAPFIMMLLLVGYGVMTWDWLFDKHDDLRMDIIMQKDMWGNVGKWFTTL